ncbi:MAG: 50S ribosomal protein L9 [Deltaproteobacteria bacterium RIFCSPLOWO2_12_FULL_44_12]|nr:MAG: 50S ribosomal protein L9 [Deltaproteobacteria bacterium RIFCSPHIGHO2_01_FULL_43_49]OGQ15909.1 MAG: 50S ribosomal protein L9 [Deltaproteobacteria bacterium RIFCSPHIGHO2_02_FULL_44_53]OGQ28872.1 MAG: 50S ribosomal protein L9 [Deltaproteobacteria bacterium RIFCSPHIGHO2_12_FULL_44_21]OGQ30964.1 MAG: 50S ribosomal protein L9 [Deltaproteobacteria bacterium RIFCSPLOWO2_01_FULL_45_74]OGQ43470.1 MAG: 50S ribosomal protein L9 [Deltaproteobacteria bacterium RIFCSPLOWO2_02_FULL_44_34]OGQ70507.1 MA
MEVILKEDVKTLGKAGEIVKVKPGFARNFLLPQGKAVKADRSNLKELEHHKKAGEARQTKLKKQADDLGVKISLLSVTIKREVGEGDKLFGSVTSKDIADALRSESILIDKKMIQLASPIKELGVFDIPVKLHAEVTANLKVWVVK